MGRGDRELLYAGLAAFATTVTYLVVTIRYESLPAARGFFGHSLGIIGFIMMLMTETLYTLRKRSHRARWGSMSTWLQFHVFTGLVGPYMVLLHTSWKFNGLAGILVLFTVVIVASGFVGRYIYTSVPRTADGVAVEASELEQRIAAVEQRLQYQLSLLPPGQVGRALALLFEDSLPQDGLLLVLGRAAIEFRHRLRWWLNSRCIRAIPRDQLTCLRRLLRQRRDLHRQVASLAMARRLLALWHAAHVPIGAVLFMVALVHIVASIYYATLLR